MNITWDYFEYNGVDSRDNGVYLVNDGQRLKNLSPSRTTISEKITGKDGEMVFDETFDGRTISLKCYIENNNLTDTREIMVWLGEKYPQPLWLSYEPYRIYQATYNRAIKLEDYGNGGIFRIEFVCKSPFAESKYSTMDLESGIEYDTIFYYDSGLYYVDSEALEYSFDNILTTTDMDIYNASNVDGAAPVITINGSADDITITHYSDEERTDEINSLSYGSFNGELVIDSNIKNVFLDGSLENNTFSGDYIELIRNGYNYFTISGTNLNLTTVDWDFYFRYL